MPPTTALLTIPETAEELRVGISTVYRWIGLEELQAVDISRPGARKSKLRVPRASLDAYIERLSGENTPAA